MAEDKIYTACIIDTETGGLDPATCAITQVSAKMIRLDTLESLGTFDMYVKPYNKKDDWQSKEKKKVLKTKRQIEQEEVEAKQFEYNPRALEVTGITMDKLRLEGEDIKAVAESFANFVTSHQIGSTRNYKPYFVGQNPIFDWGFLQHLFINAGCEDKLYTLFQGNKDVRGMFVPSLTDTILLARMALSQDPTVTTYKLENICQLLKIELVDAHSSMADVEATCGVFSVLASRMKSMAEIDPTAFIETEEKFRAHFKI